MTNDQFDFVTRLMRGNTESKANQAARAVLVDKLSQAEAVKRYGIAKATVSRAVKNYGEADQEARRVYGAQQGV